MSRLRYRSLVREFFRYHGFDYIAFANAGLQALTLYFCPDFWGPASNFGIPIAAVMDIQKDPEM